MSDTPRTDAAEKLSDVFGFSGLVAASFARELEQENIIFRKAQKLCEDCDAPTKAKFEEVTNNYAELRAFGSTVLDELQKISSWSESPDMSLEDEILVGIAGVQNRVTELERENAALRAEVNVSRKNYEEYKAENIALREDSKIVEKLCALHGCGREFLMVWCRAAAYAQKEYTRKEAQP